MSLRSLQECEACDVDFVHFLCVIILISGNEGVRNEALKFFMYYPHFEHCDLKMLRILDTMDMRVGSV